jgi:hypothetical protein
MSPEKREGALPAPIPLIQSPQRKSKNAFPQPCTHPVVRVEYLPSSHVHYAAERCDSCGAWVRWTASPKTLERRTLNAFKIAKLLMCEGLSPWQRRFVHDVSQQKKLSPKQQALVARLCATYLEAKPS